LNQRATTRGVVKSCYKSSALPFVIGEPTCNDTWSG